MRLRYRWILTATLFVSMASCGGPSGPSEDDGQSNEKVNENGEPADEVRVMGESARQSVTEFSFDIDQNQGTVRFDSSSNYAQNLEEGRIMASGPIEGPASNGMLQKVESVEQREDAIVVTTRQATLAEAFERADFEVERELTGEDVEKTQMLRPGVELETRTQGQGEPLELEFDEVLVDVDGDEGTTDDQVKMNGSVQFGASFEVDAKIESFSLEKFLFAVDLDESAELNVTGNFDGTEIDETEEVARLKLGEITFAVAGVPVVITVELVVQVGLDGTISAELEAGAEQSIEARLGAEYTSGDGWENLSEFDSSFQTPPPTFQLGSADARGFAKPRLETKLYGVAGPYMFAKPYLEFDAQLHRSPYWRLTGGIDRGLGFVVRVPVAGKVAEWEETLEGQRRQLATSSNAAPELEVLSPQDGATRRAGQSAAVEVAATDREQESVEVFVERNGERVVEGSVGPDEQVSMTVRDLCEGTREITVGAEDDQGATDSETLSLLVENAPPKVKSLEVPKVDGEYVGAYPGGYMPATVEIEDHRCADNASPDPSRVGWYVDGERVASGSKLVLPLSPADYSAGETLTLEAEYDDGSAVARAQMQVSLRSQPQDDPPLYAEIERCNVCEFAYIANESYSPNEVKLEGRGIDPNTGSLSGNSLVWEAKAHGGTRKRVGTGETATFELDEFFDETPLPDRTHTIYLTVEDDSGRTVTVEDTFDLYIGR